jgi:hypothetical protein
MLYTVVYSTGGVVSYVYHVFVTANSAEEAIREAKEKDSRVGRGGVCVFVGHQPPVAT